MTATATTTKASSTTTISRHNLLAAVQAVSKAVPSRAPKPVLHNVRIGDGLVTGTDLEVRIDRTIDVMCEPFLVDCQRLLAILRAATGGDVRFSVKDSTVTIKSGGGSWTLPTEDVSEYPTWEPADTKPVCRLPADQFVRAVNATAYATDTESSRYALGGVLIEVEGGNPTWVATDGRRLACMKTETDQDVDDQKVIVPAKVMHMVAGLASAGDGSVQVMTNGKEVTFELDGSVVTASLTDGKFPRWRDVAGEPTGEASVLEVAELLAAVRAAAIVTSEASKGVDLRWTADTLVLSARSSEYGESTVKCPLVAAGSTSGTKLDPRFLVDFLRSIPHDEEPQVQIYATSSSDRVLLKCGDYMGVIMPLAADA